MRKILVFLISFMLCPCLWADEIPMDLDDVKDPDVELGKGHRGPSLRPEVTYEDDNIYIYAPYYINSMDVVVKDVSGNVIYTYASAMVAGKNTIVLPSSVSESKYSLEISYGSFHLIGYFWM